MRRFFDWFFWWGLPILVIVVLVGTVAVLVWNGATHE